MSSLEKVTQPEAYPLKRTAHCPNNDLPVLVYRDVLHPLNEDSASERLQRHGWEKKVRMLTYQFFAFVFDGVINIPFYL